MQTSIHHEDEANFKPQTKKNKAKGTTFKTSEEDKNTSDTTHGKHGYTNSGLTRH